MRGISSLFPVLADLAIVPGRFFKVATDPQRVPVAVRGRHAPVAAPTWWRAPEKILFRRKGEEPQRRREATPHHYRPEIDGLRALAVVSVVGFHAAIPEFSGGFVGVDIFFVISGFLITTLLLDELQQRGSINLFAFFARRARRLLPAFFVVIVATLILGFVIVVPIDGDHRRLASSAIASAFYVSNLQFATVADGYFDDPSQSYPLLHTWSLAVEEQFYLVWPLMLLLAAWAARKWQFRLTSVIVGILGIVSLLSLGYSWSAAESGGRAAREAFFLLPSRAWELGIGALLALTLPHLQRSHNKVGGGLAVAGLAAICAAIFKFDQSTLFPGVAALLPTIGTAAVVAGTWIAPRAIVGRTLAYRPVVAIGLVSYSWYLWHWPLLALARAYDLETTNLARDGVIVIGALGLACLTYFFVEEPIRRRRVAAGWSNLAVLGSGATASLLVISLACLLSVNASRSLDKSLVEAKHDFGWTKHCLQWHQGFQGLLPISGCTSAGDASRKVLVIWGDSHADHSVGMLEVATHGRFAVLPRAMAGCPPLPGMMPLDKDAPVEACARFNNQVLEQVLQLEREGRLAGVVLSARWAIYPGGPSPSGDKGTGFWKDGRLTRGDAAVQTLEQGLRDVLRILTAQRIKVLVLAPVPEQRFKVPLCLARHSVQFCSLSRELVDNYRAVILPALKKSVDGMPTVHLWDPAPALCDVNNCFAERDGVVMYRDDDHLTYSGSRWLGSYLRDSGAWLAFLEDENRVALKPQATSSF